VSANIIVPIYNVFSLDSFVYFILLVIVSYTKYAAEHPGKKDLNHRADYT